MSNLTKHSRLQAFLELACYCPSVGRFVLMDASDPENKDRAMKWLNNELVFLGKHDREDLIAVWKEAMNDGRKTKMLFNTVKILQSKYSDSPGDVCSEN